MPAAGPGKKGQGGKAVWIYEEDRTQAGCELHLSLCFFVRWVRRPRRCGPDAVLRRTGGENFSLSDH